MLKESSNISQANSSHKRQKKLPLLTIKKSKKRNTHLPSKNRCVLPLKKIRKFKKPNYLKDDISLETNSTTNTLEEENIISNAEMNQYLNEIENVVNDIKEKGFYSLENSAKNFFEKIDQNESKKEHVKYKYKNLEDLFDNIKPQEKIKLILDIDETLVYSQIIQEININKKVNNFSELNEINQIKKIAQDEYYINIMSDIDETTKKIFVLKVNIRKGLALFFKKLTPFCEFYINTMASKPYVLEILKIFI